MSLVEGKVTGLVVGSKYGVTELISEFGVLVRIVFCWFPVIGVASEECEDCGEGRKRGVTGVRP